jgi:hypothetical protein
MSRPKKRPLYLKDVNSIKHERGKKNKIISQNVNPNKLKLEGRKNIAKAREKKSGRLTVLLR